MSFDDVISLVPAYGGLAALVFAGVYAPLSLWRYFKGLADPGFRND
jgi:hypothetical protein